MWNSEVVKAPHSFNERIACLITQSLYYEKPLVQH